MSVICVLQKFDQSTQKYTQQESWMFTFCSVVVSEKPIIIYKWQ